MKNKFNIYIIIFLIAFFTACGKKENNQPENSDHKETLQHNHDPILKLSNIEFENMKLSLDTIFLRNMSTYIEANGRLEVPPQNEATVTATIGANISSIHVIEGEEVSKSQVLAYLTHPDLIQLQTEYLNNKSQLQYLENEFSRQQKLYDGKVGAGKEFEKIKAEYKSMKATVEGLKHQLELLSLNPDKVSEDNIFKKVPVRSPINGFVRFVEVKTGQYVQPQTEMFEIVNIKHIHADLMVFEKDAHKAKKGQKVRFKVQSLPEVEMEASVYAVGKSFEEEPKALHIHAEIENKMGTLIPGMFVRGQILTETRLAYALPEEAIVMEDSRSYIFTAQKDTSYGEEWTLTATEVTVASKSDKWVEIILPNNFLLHTQVVQNNAFYLMAELKKHETEHSH